MNERAPHRAVAADAVGALMESEGLTFPEAVMRLANGGAKQMDKKVESLPAHPVAELFPMMTDDELAALAEDIKANGLIHPIILDAEGKTLIDGRNRLAACKRAGIEPRFNRLNGQDPWAYTISANVKRRNLTPGQRAYAAAAAWTAAEAEGRVQKQGPKQKGQNTQISDPRTYFAKQFDASDKYVRMVRDFLAPVDDGGDPAAARRIRDGADLLNEHKQWSLKAGQEKSEARRRRELERTRPDLAQREAAGELTLDEGFRQAEADEAQRKQLRWTATVNLIQAIEILDREPKFAGDFIELFDQRVELEKGSEKITRERLSQCRDFLLALEEAWIDREDAQ
jgi:hypothetical protein